MKKTITENNEENKEANKNIGELQEKLKKDIKIHEAKKPREDRPPKEENKGEDNEFE